MPGSIQVKANRVFGGIVECSKESIFEAQYCGSVCQGEYVGEGCRGLVTTGCMGIKASLILRKYP